MPRKAKHKMVSDINAVPFIDVMLVLLVVFMVTAPLLTQGVSVELPEAPSKPIDIDDNAETLIVSIKSTGEYFIDLGDDPEKAVSLDLIGEQVGKILSVQPQTPVLVRGDKSVPYGKVIELMTVLQNAGVPNLGLISDPPNE